ncbi:MAG: hypothetical protein KDC35_20405 [Acidobacteria bacterium]|nr:hypothetical protein [Acidobacteriota bacterium]
MSKLLDLFRLIPGTGRVISLLIIIGGAIFFVYYRFGTMPAVFLAGGILVIFLLIFIYNLVLKASERQNGIAFGKAISNAQVGASSEEVKSAVSAMAQKWREANVNLKTAGLDMYTLPWYMLIGEPQSGKSTTLKFSGIKFPIGMESISGGGGTRNCDWWFTEQAVILDTAGRLTFQEENATDAAEWNHFLNLLAKHRPYCPINGVMLVIPATSLLGDDAATRHMKARNISEKLLNIQRTLSIQFPVFVVITKADTIYGFTQFFNKLNVDQQREMFGWSSPSLESGFNINTFDQSFGQLIERVDQIKRRNLSRTHYSDDANKTFIFPEEFRALYQPLREYMSIIFEDSVYRAPMFFRGYYITSGMQEGQPIASACKALLKKGTVIPNLEQVFTKSRAFFIRDFYTEKVFPEEGLVQRAFHHVRADKIKRRLIYGLNISFVVLGALFMVLMYRNLNARLAGPKRTIDETLILLADNQGTFFTSDDDREEIFKNLKNLQSAITIGQAGGSFNFFKGKQNALTAHLQDTFSYVYLDRFLVGLYDSVVQQLAAFEQQSPQTPRNSDAELTLLLHALAEVNNWRYHSKNDTLDELKPSLQPFLALALDPEWNSDLASHLVSLNLQEQLEQWFQEVHARSSDEVKGFVIQALVHRSEQLFQGLDKAVLDFYVNQPEMQRYLEKLKVLEELDSAYAETLVYISPSDYHEKLMRFASYFSPENQEMLGPGGDQYLKIPEVVERTAKALGTPYDKVGTADEKLNSRDRKRLELQPDTATFMRALRAFDPKNYRDPRAEREGDVPNPEGLTYSKEIKSFWDELIKGYAEVIAKSNNPYSDLPEVGAGRDASMDSLFTRGYERMVVIAQMSGRGINAHVGVMTDSGNSRLLEKNILDYTASLTKAERKLFSDAFVRSMGEDTLKVPPPSSSNWSSIVEDLRQKTDRGRHADWFLTPADEVKSVFRQHNREVETIFGTLALTSMNQYTRDVEDHTKRFYSAVQGLANINQVDLAQNRGQYTNNIPRDIEDFADIGVEETPYLEMHRVSLDAWSRAVIDAFLNYAGNVDPCPECSRDLNEIRTLAKNIGNAFPVATRNVMKINYDELGLANAWITTAREDDLTKLVAAIEKFRSPDATRSRFLKNKRLEARMEHALAWSDTVRKLQDGTLTLRYKLEPSVEADAASREFTFCDLKGYFTARRIALNSPAYRDITVNPDTESNNISAAFRLFNDTEGNDSESRIVVHGKALELFGFVLADMNQGSDTYDRQLDVPLNYANRTVKGLFRFRFSEPVTLPPNWSDF